MSLEKEDGIKRKLILLVLIILFILVFGTVGFSLTENTTFGDGFFKTVEVISFLYEGETHGSAKIVKLFLALFGVILFWMALWETFDILMESKLVNFNFQEARIMNKIKKLKNHYIICGGGRVGHHLGNLLQQQKKSYVIIEKDEFNINQLRKKGHLVYEGDSLEEETLEEAGIRKAKCLMSVLPESEKNIMIILTAKELNKKLKIFARSHKEEYIKKMKKAGADFVVTPEISCAEELSKLAKT